jgi:quercetin dioxygenase-like cupin family protein
VKASAVHFACSDAARISCSWGSIIRRAPVKLRMAVLATALVACSTTAPPVSNAAALPRGEVVERLDAGQVASLPTGTVYVRFVRFVQPPGYVINSKQHVPSIVYVEKGVHRLVLTGQPPIDLVAGQATFHQSVTHQHLNPGPDTSTWYSIAVWPSSARGQPLVDPIAQAAFESEDIDRAALPEVAHTEVLRHVTLAKGGTSGAHRFGGLMAFYVLSGSIAIRTPHQGVKTLGVAQGAAFLPQTDLQETNAGSEPATYLEFAVTPVGREFEVPLQQPPAA